MTTTRRDHVPSNWAMASLGEVCDKPEYGWTTSAAEDGNLKLLRTTDITKPVLDWSAVPFCKDNPPDPARFLLRQGDIVISRAGSVGVSKLLSSVPRAVFASYLIRFRPKNGMESKYIAFFLQSPDYWNAITESAAGIALPNVNAKKLAAIPIPVAPPREQHRIVEEIEKQFTRLDAAVAALKRVQANLKRYRAAVLKAACEGRLVPTEAEVARREGRSYEPARELLERILAERRSRREAAHTGHQAHGKEPSKLTTRAKYQEPAFPDTGELGPLPEGWIWAKAEQICDFITKGTTPAAHKLFADAGEVPYIKVYNLTNRGRLDFSVNPTFVARATHEGELARSRVFPNDVLMNIVGPPLGKVSVVPPEYAEWNVNQAIAIFRPMPSFSIKYLSYCLLSENVLSWAIRRSKATAGQFNLTLEICRDLPIPVPPADEQRRIVSELERRLSVIEEMELQGNNDSTRAGRLRQAILKRAFQGNLVPQDPNDEPADTLLLHIRSAGRENPQSKMQKKGKEGTLCEQRSLLPHN